MPSGITFPVDSYSIQPQFRTTLDQVAQTLSSYNQTYIDVLGHTDSTGSDAYNQSLSERRAGAVADYLSSRGVSRARMGVRGSGETPPTAGTPTEPGRQPNPYFAIVIGGTSWNQFWAWTKPFTFALIARGFTSCVTIRNSASSTYFSPSTLRRTARPAL